MRVKFAYEFGCGCGLVWIRMYVPVQLWVSAEEYVCVLEGVRIL